MLVYTVAYYFETSLSTLYSLIMWLFYFCSIDNVKACTVYRDVQNTKCTPALLLALAGQFSNLSRF